MDTKTAGVRVVDLRRPESLVLNTERANRLAIALCFGYLFALTFSAIFGNLLFEEIAQSSTEKSGDLVGRFLPVAFSVAVPAAALALLIFSGARFSILLSSFALLVVWTLVLLLGLASLAVWIKLALVNGSSIRAPASFDLAGFLILANDAQILLLVGMLALAVWLMIEPLAALVQAIFAAAGARSARIRTLRGTRSLGGSLQGLLAIFDIPVGLVATGRRLPMLLALASILIGALGVFAWMSFGLGLLAYPIFALVRDCNTAIIYLPEYVAGFTPYRAACVTGNVTDAIQSGAFVFVGGLFLSLLAAVLMRLAKDAAVSTKNDPHPGSPVVFLRSFADDGASVPSGRHLLLDVFLNLGRTPDSVDQILVYEFSRFGPVYALGKPGEKRPPFGAQRIYSEHADWQGRVLDFVERSAAVVLVADVTPSLQWEIRQTLSNEASRRKTLYLFRSDAAADAFRANHTGLPPLPASRRKRCIVAAHQQDGEWTWYVTRRPSRLSFQIAARLFFSAIVGDPRPASRENKSRHQKGRSESFEKLSGASSLKP